MSLSVDDVAAYLLAQSVAVPGTNLFRFAHTTTPDKQLALIPYGGLPSEQAFGDEALKWEFPRLQVSARGERDDDRSAVTLATAAYVAIGKVIAATLSGTFYHRLVCLQPPFRLGVDDSGRPMWVFNVEGEKEVGA